MDLSLSGKTAIVSNGCSPFGSAVAVRLLQEGARVAIGGQDARTLWATLAALGAHGEARAIPMPGGDPVVGMPQMVRAAVVTFGAPDILVADVCEPLEGTLDTVTAERLAAYLRDGLVALWAFVQAGAAHMPQDGGGRIVLLINAAGKIPSRDFLAAAVLGAAQHAFVKSVSDHFGPLGITVNAVCVGTAAPGAAGTGIGTEPYLGRGLGQQESGWGTAPPLGRWCTPEHVADAVAFLASARAGFVTGANIDVDGGQQRMIF
ncbi:MAG: SDR family oxidoreductase [Pseudomonadota bacterium]